MSKEALATDDQAVHSGTWRLVEKPNTKGAHPDFPELEYFHIESTDNSRPYGHALSIAGYMRRSDARLMVMAPELLALAEQYASECASCNGEGYVLHMGTCERCDCLDCADIRAVIAKAGGRLPNDEREPPEPDGESYRGGEWAAAQAEESARVQRELKR